jgi:hypothetical protein
MAGTLGSEQRCHRFVEIDALRWRDSVETAEFGGIGFDHGAMLFRSNITGGIATTNEPAASIAANLLRDLLRRACGHFSLQNNSQERLHKSFFTLGELT